MPYDDTQRRPLSEGGILEAVAESQEWMRAALELLVHLECLKRPKLAERAGLKYATLHGAMARRNSVTTETFAATAVAVGVDPVEALREGRRVVTFREAPGTSAGLLLRRHCAATGTGFEDALSRAQARAGEVTPAKPGKPAKRKSAKRRRSGKAGRKKAPADT